MSGPSNLTLDTISDVLLAFNAEADPPEIVFFKDRAQPNYVHPLMARALNIAPAKTPAKVETTNGGAKIIKLPKPVGNEVDFKVEARAG